MSQTLDPVTFPLQGSRLIEASAGTGKTWTIAALYVRLVLGHGEQGFGRALLPSEILVMTFTRSATRELSDRVRARLVEAAAYFRGEIPCTEDPFLQALLDDYPEPRTRAKAAHRLMLAADAMDTCAIFTIDAWCQRMLREHAFDSGSLFDEELVSSERGLFQDAVRDYWREQIYPLTPVDLDTVLASWANFDAFEKTMRPLMTQVALLGPAKQESLAEVIARVTAEQQAHAATLKTGWAPRAAAMEAWLATNRNALSGNKLRVATLAQFFSALHDWINDPTAIQPAAGFAKAWDKLTPAHLALCVNNGHTIQVPDEFEDLAPLQQALAGMLPLATHLLKHAALHIAERMNALKQRSRQFSFADMLTRLRTALDGSNGAALAQRITDQYPVALIDEFQDTSPDQYRIFDALYRIDANDVRFALLLIGDPKQAIYSFRGADLHCYLEARGATAGRHYFLGTNFRSSQALVAAVNHVFLHAEGRGSQAGHTAGAFRFRQPDGSNPLPFDEVGARGRKEGFVYAQGALAPLTLWCNAEPNLTLDGYRRHFANQCAEQIASLLNDAGTGFVEDGQLTRLQPADIAILVRDRYEAKMVRRALQHRRISSVYLSDQDSVFAGDVALDVLLWLRAIGSPQDARLARAALATRTAGLPLSALAQLATEEVYWEARSEQLKALHTIWQRQGVLAMLRRFLHELDLPAVLLNQPGGERELTDVLHIAELLQGASLQLDGEQALIRWLAEQIEQETDGREERIVRLESDAELVQVITVHKSKGLEYPLVFLPFAVAAKPVTRRNREFCTFRDTSGAAHIDFAMTESSMQAMDDARLEEDVRLLYVALTRARHALWLGIACIGKTLPQSAVGYLLGGGTPITADQLLSKLQIMRADNPHISIDADTATSLPTRLTQSPHAASLIDPVPFSGIIERNWMIASYTSITRDLGTAPTPATPLAEKLLENDDADIARIAPRQRQDVAWHRFPRGALAGQFLHEQLEWLANEGFEHGIDGTTEVRLRARIERAGWGARSDDAIIWLAKVMHTPLPPLGVALCDLASVTPEMEFWFPTNALATQTLDTLCQTYFLDGIARPPLSDRQLHGMLRGFQDLVFEHEGRYWVLDYKSNMLGPGDDDYHATALATGMAANRYDVQGTIYLLALHRLLQSRLGTNYEPSRQLGGALFYFLRGVANAATHGCYHLPATPALLDALDDFMSTSTAMEDAA